MDWTVKKYPAFCGGVKQAYPHVAPGQPFYSRSATVGSLLFLSAVSATSPETGQVETKTIEAQVTGALSNLQMALEEAGGSLNNLVRTTLLVRNREDLERVRRTELQYYQNHAPLLVEAPPATGCIVTNLEKPEYLVQIDSLAVITRGEPGWEMRKYPASYAGLKQSYPYVPPGRPMFSRSAVVGNLIFCSGANARSLITGDIEAESLEEQMVIALDKVKISMEEAGGSLRDVIKTVIHLKDVPADYSRMRKTEAEYYLRHALPLAEDPPASTVCQAHLESPECLVEIDAVGVISRNKPDWKVKKYPAYYGGVKFAHPHVTPGQPMFSRSAVAGNIIFCSGATGLALGSFKQSSLHLEDQMLTTMNKLKTYMEQAGSCMENIVKTIVYIRNMEDYPALRKAELEFYQINAPALVGDPPASTVIEAPLHQPETLMEIEAFGVIPG